MATADSSASGTVDPGVPSLDGLGDPVVAISGDGTLLYANTVASEVLDWNPADLIGTSVLDLIHPADLSLAVAALQTVGTKRFGDLITIRARTGRGTWVYLEIRGAQAQSADGDGEAPILVVARDVTHRHRLDFDQGDTGVLRAVMANMHGMVVLADEKGAIRSINGAVTRLLGYDPELIRGRSIFDYLHPADREHVLDAVRSVPPHGSVTLDARLLAADYNGPDEEIVCEFTVNNLLDDPVVRSYVISAQIATALADARNRVNFLAEHDSRTGLLNRDGFLRHAEALVAQGGGLGILVVDIVHFRSINELYGEPTGDAVLSAIAERIDKIRWPDLITARFGGDEFVLAVRASNQSALEMLRDRVKQEVSQPFVIGDQEVNFRIRTASAFDAQPEVLDSLLVSASNELMAAKRFSEAETTGISVDAINERRRQLDQLRTALANGEIRPFYQPIVDPAGQIVAVEALVRWVHPVRGVLGVSEILPLAQMAGLAEAVDDCVLDMALDFAVRLAEAGHGDTEVHINIDPKVMAQPSFGVSFLERCRRAGANPTQLVVEITENDLLAPGASALANMQKLRFAGIHVTIDDFGTGYSSLAHLLELPVDGVKIDRRFVAGIDVDPAATNLTTAIIGLSDSLRLGCVAEGVEQPYQRDRLIELGCTALQGWLFSPAVSAEEALAMMPRIVLTDHVQTFQRVPR